MPITSFSVVNDRGVRLASCQSIPPVMIITGPNGCGKSTLLIAIKRSHGHERPVYIAPHRSIRRQTISSRFLVGRQDLADVLTQDHVGRFEGIQIFDQARDPWNADESGNLIKYNIAQTADDINNIIAAKYFENGEIKRGEIVNIWTPLSKLISALLPQLEFARVDASQKSNIRFLFRKTKTDIEIDFDELSSGEKSLIQLFLPLIEIEIRELMNDLQGHAPTSLPNRRPVIIDEPELHLHPNLQESLLTYMRELALSGRFQFIISTHSQTLVEAASPEELFLMKPSTAVEEGDNQLTQIADDQSKLDLIGEVFGRQSNLTAFRSIVLVEGRKIGPLSQTSSDQKIYNIIDSRFKTLTLVPCNSKSECLSRAQDARKLLGGYSKKIQAVALIDSDLDEPGFCADSAAYRLPVSMIENFLVDPETIWLALRLVHEKTALTADSIEAAIDEILDGMRQHEIDRRVKAVLGHDVFRVPGPLANATNAIQEHIVRIQGKYAPESVDSLIRQAEAIVDDITLAKRRREKFDGKYIVEEFYKRHLTSTGLSKEIFKYHCAESAAQRSSVRQFCNSFFGLILTS